MGKCTWNKSWEQVGLLWRTKQLCRRQHWFQQDGASLLNTAPGEEICISIFNDRVISRDIEHHFPTVHAVVVPYGHFFLNQAIEYMHENLSVLYGIIEDMKKTVEDSAAGRLRGVGRTELSLRSREGGPLRTYVVNIYFIKTDILFSFV